MTGAGGGGESAEAAAMARAVVALGWLPPRLSRPAAKLLSQWPGRILIKSAAAFMRIEMFDRSMTIAAQFFTSVIPILILTATLTGSGNADRIADAMGMTDSSLSIIQQTAQGVDSAAYSIVGTVIVFASATSLSRALTRAFAVIWAVPRPKSKLGSVWRWLAVVLVLAFALVFVHGLSERASVLPPREVWPFAVTLTCDLAVAVFVPWVLLSGTVTPRLLAPGALIFALVMLAARPASAAWLPRALDNSADRYGSIGVAFTCLAWLYVAAFLFLGTAVVGQVIATDRGGIGDWIRHGHHAGEKNDDSHSESAPFATQGNGHAPESAPTKPWWRGGGPSTTGRPGRPNPAEKDITGRPG